MLRMVHLPGTPLDGNREGIDVADETDETEISNEVRAFLRLSQSGLDEVHELLECNAF